MRKTNILFLFALAGLFSLAACTGDEIANEENGKNSGSASAGMIFFSGEPSTRTRTSITHTIGGEGKVTWSDNDQIWVKDDGGNWGLSQQATFPIPNRKTNAMFSLNESWSSSYSKPTHDVVYNHSSFDAIHIRIEEFQVQSKANNFDHAEQSGDFGVAKAKRISAGNYKFTLEHKASYLCLLPRSSDPSVHRSKLVKIQILSDDTIAGIYNIDTDGSLIFDSNPSKEINLLLGGWSGTGFDIDNSSTDIEKNGAYAVIVPGTHHLAIRYFLKNTTDFSNPNKIGCITKWVTLNCEPGKIHDITSNLTIPDFSHIKFYQWDAQQPIGWAENNLTMASLDPRFYNPAYPYHATGEGTHSAASAPNVNELCWYVEHGNSMHDESEIWRYEGKLYAGGLWMKKKATIIAEQGTSAPAMVAAAPNGTDYRAVGPECNYSKYVNNGAPTDSEKYFFIPYFNYPTGVIQNSLSVSYNYFVPGETDAFYLWSSTVDPNYYSQAYGLRTNGSQLEVHSDSRLFKFPVFPFK